MPLELGLHGGGRELVGELQLDRPESGRGGGRKPLHERALGEQIGEIGGEAGHADLLFASREIGQWGGSTLWLGIYPTILPTTAMGYFVVYRFAAVWFA